jgi:hypothetical protein
VNFSLLNAGRLMRTGRAKLGVLGGVLSLLLAAAAAQAAERLVLEPYPGGPWYDVVNQANNGAFIREQAPQGETGSDLLDVLTSQAVPGYQGQPADYLASTLAELGQTCETVQTVGPTVSEEQGRQVAYGRVYCGRQKGQSLGIHFFFKAILGNEALYLVGRGFRTPGSDHPAAPAFPEAAKAVAFLQAEGVATKYLTSQIYVCDPVFPDPKCSSEAVPTGP